MIEALESRELFSASHLPAVQEAAFDFSRQNGAAQTEVAGVVWSGVYDRAGAADPSAQGTSGQSRGTEIQGVVWSGVYDRA